MKRILVLGGSDLQVSFIKLAKSLGHFVITCDYLPNNPGHKFSDKYFNVSTTDKEAVLALAEKLSLDGVSAYASDPAAETAAWVCEKLDLPTNPYESVKILSRKDLFREHMKENGFLIPKSNSFSQYKKAFSFFKEMNTKCIIKPVDSSGSKGIYALEKSLNFKDFKILFNKSISYSRVGKIIIETFINKKGYQIGGDGFLLNGELVFRCFGDIHFSKTNHLLPCSVSMPTVHKNDIVEKVHSEIQRLMLSLDMKFGGLNFDIFIDKNDKIYIIEIGPRNGGNLLPELIELCTGIDMKLYSIKTCIGDNVNDFKLRKEKSFFSHYVLHSQISGVFMGIEKSQKIEKHILYENLKVTKGDRIGKFDDSSNRLGMLLLKYENHSQMVDIIYNMHKHYKIIVND